MQPAGVFLGITYVILFIGKSSGQDGEATYVIKTTWDNKPINQADQVTFRIFNTHLEEDKVLGIEITAPFYNDPPPPGEPGRFDGLWDYEVAEIFFLGSDDNYLELEFGPHKHYLAYYLEGVRNVTDPDLTLEPNTKLNTDTNQWTTTVLIPEDYLPPGVNAFNAYAIHGEGPNRVYSALFPNTEENPTGPDFHALKFFQPINLDNLSGGSINSFVVNYWVSFTLLFILATNVFV